MARARGARPEEWRKKHRAHVAVQSALAKGFLIRAEACSICGIHPAPRKDGRSGIQAHHHHGYDAQLDVRWVCCTCHRTLDPKAPPRTHCPRGHPYSGDNLYLGKYLSDKRCRLCARERDRIRNSIRRARAKALAQ